MTSAAPPIQEVIARERVILAPLVGGSDVAYRLLCRRYGARVTFTEMCVARFWNNAATRREHLFSFDPADRPLILQLTDSAAEPIVSMARNEMFQGRVDALDLNLGCPQMVAQKGCFGAYLVELKGIDYVVALAKQVVDGVRPLPVTCKLRLHKDLATTTAYVRRLFDEAGVAAVTIHGRFLWQRGSKRGDCDWAAIDAIKAAMPTRCIIGNGDVRSHAQLLARLASSRADAVMVGYGALRDPTLFGAEAVPLQRVLQEYIDLARQHPNKLIDVKRHLGWLTKAVCKTKLERFRLFDAATLDDVVAVLATFDPPLVVVLPPLAERAADKIVEERALTEPPANLKPRARKRVLKAMRRAVKRRSRNLEKALEHDAAAKDGKKRAKSSSSSRASTKTDDNDSGSGSGSGSGSDGDDDEDGSERSDEGQG